MRIKFDLPEEALISNQYLLEKDEESIELQDCYSISETEKKILETVSGVSSTASSATEIITILTTILNSDSTYAFRSLMLIELVYLLKYLDITYPPNVLVLFNSSYKSTNFIKAKLEEHPNDSKQVIGNFKIYGISAYAVNNVGEATLQILILIILGYIYSFIYKKIEDSKNFYIVKIADFFNKLLIWNITIVIIFTKFQDLCFYTFTTWAFLPIYSNKGYINIAYSIIIFIFVLMIPFHIGNIIYTVNVNKKNMFQLTNIFDHNIINDKNLRIKRSQINKLNQEREESLRKKNFKNNKIFPNNIKRRSRLNKCLENNQEKRNSKDLSNENLEIFKYEIIEKNSSDRKINFEKFTLAKNQKFNENQIAVETTAADGSPSSKDTQFLSCGRHSRSASPSKKRNSIYPNPEVQEVVKQRTTNVFDIQKNSIHSEENIVENKENKRENNNIKKKY